MMNSETESRLPSVGVATGLPPNHAVMAAWGRFKTTQPDDYFKAVLAAADVNTVHDALFDVFMRGWIEAGGKVG